LEIQESQVTDVKLLPPAHGTPSGRVAPDRMQVVAIENYGSAMFADAWMRFQQRSRRIHRTVLRKKTRSIWAMSNKR
ncbi:hypothetical protein, partial [Xanthomonas oryzae]|uniref:hypothetical protein n=1 Tax=Xanthomonas oryzae TaxID=347 RepID=UPI001C4A3C83